MSCVAALAAESASLVGRRSPGGFEVEFVTEVGVGRCVALAEAQLLPFERFRPLRRFAARKGQRHLSGLWWSATTGGHVGFESWLERDHLMLLDFDPRVAGISSQPFWLCWPGEGGRPVCHAPDYFARREDGSAIVMDCRPAERRGPADVAKFAATARACALVGWQYRGHWHRHFARRETARLGPGSHRRRPGPGRAMSRSDAG
jgi:hypothetical protein